MRTPKKQKVVKPRKVRSLKQLETIGNVSEITLNYRSKVKISEAPKISGSYDAYKVLKTMWSDQIEYVEEFVILLLNRANRVLGAVKISKGGISGTVADAKVIFQAALVASASNIILCHNHPSGNLKPSSADIRLTNNLVELGRKLELHVLDHLIITLDNYYSFVDSGLI